MNPMIQTRWLALSERAYRVLLMLYPADYRREYGALMLQFFRDMSREKYQQRGMGGVMLWWCKTLLDLTLTVIEQRRKVRFTMSKATFMQLTGMLLVVGGAFTALAAFSQLQPDNHYSYNGIYQLLIWLLAPGLLLVGLGCIGLALRYESTLGTVGQWTLYISSIGAAMMAVGLVATSIRESLWNIWLIGSIVHMSGLIAFGILHLRKPFLPIFRALPLQMALGWLILMLGVLRTDSQTANNLLSFLLVVGMGLAWLAIGLTINRQQKEVVLAEA